ncbi:hypothetical protein MWU61_14845 [Loktanella sp. F6476L]|uniref:hypothetical protein n=1 Tax=Loktanella sp. F6476L TaxID=2926405 RepID=UPI001FF68465|nr:hypothetical protein [Loktanella sp. F6476L]MCK0121826.1 hypothetical protein [Loktanella sp. F6476L]
MCSPKCRPSSSENVAPWTNGGPVEAAGVVGGRSLWTELADAIGLIPSDAANRPMSAAGGERSFAASSTNVCISLHG